MIRRIGTALVVALALAVTAGADGASAATECGLKKTKRVLRTDRIVVTSIVLEYERPRVRRHYACERGSSTRYRLDDPSAEFDEYGEFWDHAYIFRTNRNYLAYAREFGNDTGDYIKTEIVVLNVRTGRRRIDSVLDRGDETRLTSYNFATDLVVSSGGIAAWIAAEGFRGEQSEYPWEVERARRGKLTPLTLDAGREVRPHSLVPAAGGARAAWRHGSSRRSASLR